MLSIFSDVFFNLYLTHNYFISTHTLPSKVEKISLIFFFTIIITLAVHHRGRNGFSVTLCFSELGLGTLDSAGHFTLSSLH